MGNHKWPFSNLLFSASSDVTVELPLTLMHPKPKGNQAPAFLFILPMAKRGLPVFLCR